MTWQSPHPALLGFIIFLSIDKEKQSVPSLIVMYYLPFNWQSGSVQMTITQLSVFVTYL